MNSLPRIAKLHGRQRLRKCALLLERAELDIAEGGDWEKARGLALELASFLVSDTETKEDLTTAATACVASLASGQDPMAVLRSINDFRHCLVRLSGQSPADWDLRDYRSQTTLTAPTQGFENAQVVGVRAGSGAGAGSELGVDSGTGVGSGAGQGKLRSFYPGLRVFLEDIRSPFNVGSILRTAEALGFEEVLLSPACADPRHSRAVRSSMGAVDLIPWRRCELEELSAFSPLIALELGGTSIEDFSFPSRGLLLLGSEELGLSQPALALSGSSRISIPMKGIKASLNVAVAFGIAAQAWIGYKTQS